MTPQEHAHRLNMCLEAGLTVVIGQFGGWSKWSFNPNAYHNRILAVDVEAFDFLVLRPGETVDSFTIED